MATAGGARQTDRTKACTHGEQMHSRKTRRRTDGTDRPRRTDVWKDPPSGWRLRPSQGPPHSVRVPPRPAQSHAAACPPAMAAAAVALGMGPPCSDGQTHTRARTRALKQTRLHTQTHDTHARTHVRAACTHAQSRTIYLQSFSAHTDTLTHARTIPLQSFRTLRMRKPHSGFLRMRCYGRCYTLHHTLQIR
jgi:hypothetical protein